MTCEKRSNELKAIWLGNLMSLVTLLNLFLGSHAIIHAHISLHLYILVFFNILLIKLKWTLYWSLTEEGIYLIYYFGIG